MQILRSLNTFLVCLGVGGCSLFGDNAQHYLEAERMDDVVLPDDVEQLEKNERLWVPFAPQPETLPERFVAPRPQPLDLALYESDQAQEESKEWAQEINARLVTDGNGSPILRFDVEFPQAWVELGKALKRQKIPIEDRDRSVGTYYVRLEDSPKDDEADSGWFTSDVPGLYEVKVNRARSGIYVALHESADRLADNEFARRFLKNLQSAFADSEL